jgi:hypothetical protein
MFEWAGSWAAPLGSKLVEVPPAQLTRGDLCDNSLASIVLELMKMMGLLVKDDS